MFIMSKLYNIVRYIPLTLAKITIKSDSTNIMTMRCKNFHTQRNCVISRRSHTKERGAAVVAVPLQELFRSIIALAWIYQ